MKHENGYDDKFETEIWYFWSNMKVLLEHLDWGLSTKGSHSVPADETFWVCVLSAVFLSGQTFS